MLDKLPWISAMAVLCAFAMAVWAAQSGASRLVAVGLGLTNLGYLLLVAGVTLGRFGILGLTRRWLVFLSAAAAWLAGMILVNLHEFPD